MRRALAATLLVLSACRARARPSADPASATTPIAPAPAAESLVFFRGDVVDLANGRLVASLAPNARDGVVRNGTAYAVQDPSVLSAFDAKGGAARWTIHAWCGFFVAIDRGIVCSDGAKATLYPADGSAPELLPTTSTESVARLGRFRDRIAILRDNGDYDVYDDRGKPLAATAHGALFVGDNAVDFAVVGDRACEARITPTTWTELEIACLDPFVPEVRREKIALTDASDPKGMMFNGVRFAPPRLVYASTRDRGVVVDLATLKEVARVDHEIDGLVTDADGAYVTFATYDLAAKQLVVSPSSGGAAIVLPSSNEWYRATGVAVDGTYAIAAFDPNALVTDLRGYDPAKGADRWTGDLALAPPPLPRTFKHAATSRKWDHPMYSNDVEVSAAFGRVIVRGRDSAQAYLEIVDPKTGANVFRDVKSGH